MSHEYAIGDIVKIKNTEDVGQIVEIVDKLYSERLDEVIYRVKEYNSDRLLAQEYNEESLEPVDMSTKYICEVVDGGNVIIANIYSECLGERKLIVKGHGHTIHNGALGFTQALSYALKRAWLHLEHESVPTDEANK